MAIDFETNGLPPTHAKFKAVGMSIATETQVYYIDLTSAEPYAESLMYEMLLDHDLLAHNVVFEQAVLYRLTGQMYRFAYCTYGLYRHLSSEGFPGQRWGLKNAMVELLGWEETNERDLDAWLMNNGHIKGKGKAANPDKSKMYLAPPEVLGFYCALDSDATYQLFVGVMKPALYMFPDYDRYHKREFMHLIDSLVEQQFNGILLDVDKLNKYNNELAATIQQSADKFMYHEEVGYLIDAYNQRVVGSYKAKEPSKIRKDGKPSKAWDSWNEKINKLSTQNHFNLDSDKQLRWLFYEGMKKPVSLLTNSGLPAISGKVLNQFGEPGKLLRRYNELVKEKGYVDTCLGYHVDGVLNIQMKCPGTLTGRLAGAGGLNVQQIPKSQGYMECWIPRPGHVWVNSDFASLEQVVLAELSEDPTLFKLYGPDAKPNDVYLFNAAHMYGLADEVRKHYNPDDPTEAMLRSAKKKCKKQRSISKIITLASSYGAGTGKLLETMQMAGVRTSWDEVEKMRDSYWQLYEGIKRYGARLERQWNSNGGWVYNGLGRPMPVAPKLTKDLMNRVVQSTGHDILMVYVYYLSLIRRQHELQFTYIIPDFHDQVIVECKEEDIAKTTWAFEEAYRLLNEELCGTIKMKGDIEVCRNLWEAKA